MKKLITLATAIFLLVSLLTGCVNLDLSDQAAMDVLGFGMGINADEVHINVDTEGNGSATLHTEYGEDRIYKTGTKNAVDPMGISVDFESSIVNAVDNDGIRDARLMLNTYAVPLNNLAGLGDDYAAQDNFANVIAALQADIDAVFYDPDRYSFTVHERDSETHPHHLAITSHPMATVTATPDEGNVFIYWRTDGYMVLSTEEVYTFEIVESLNLVAEFVPAPETFDISVTISPEGGGTVTGAGTYQIDDTVVLDAIPAANYSFIGWYVEGLVVSTETQYQFPAYEDLQIEARFKTTQSTVTISPVPSAGGTVSGGGTFEQGETVVLIASPATGYSFTGWYIGDILVSSDAEYSFAAEEDITLEARFLEYETPLPKTGTSNHSQLWGMLLIALGLGTILSRRAQQS